MRTRQNNDNQEQPLLKRRRSNPAPPPTAATAKKKRPIERRRQSQDFKKKQFKLRQERLKKWRAGIKARRLEREALEVKKREKENILPIYENKRKRLTKTALDCPLDTCPKKVQLIARKRKLEASTTEEEGTMSDVTQISDQSARSRTPLKIRRGNST